VYVEVPPGRRDQRLPDLITSLRETLAKGGSARGKTKRLQKVRREKCGKETGERKKQISDN